MTMKLILICGPWSSGTTAVAGMLDQLGMNGMGPFFQTNDERTKNSFESLAFRTVIDQLADETTLELKAERPKAVKVLKAFREQLEADGGVGENPELQIFLKYPLSALLIPQIARVFDTRLIYVLRPLKDIEATRTRRGWAPHLGAAGAQVLYSRMFQVLVDLPIPTLVVRYPELLATRRRHAKQIATFCGLDVDKELIDAAAQSVRKS
jgi:hypothetical protein